MYKNVSKIISSDQCCSLYDLFSYSYHLYLQTVHKPQPCQTSGWLQPELGRQQQHKCLPWLPRSLALPLPEIGSWLTFNSTVNINTNRLYRVCTVTTKTCSNNKVTKNVKIGVLDLVFVQIISSH